MLKEFTRFVILILLLLVYLLLITPIGWMLRIKNKFKKKDDQLSDSYRTASKTRTKDHLNKMY